MSVVDDYGRYTAHPGLLLAACYPLQLDRTTTADVSRWLTEVQAELVTVYRVGGKPYLELLDFKQQIRKDRKGQAVGSKCPTPQEADVTAANIAMISACIVRTASVHRAHTASYTEAEAEAGEVFGFRNEIKARAPDPEPEGRPDPEEQRLAEEAAINREAAAEAEAEERLAPDGPSLADLPEDATPEEIAAALVRLSSAERQFPSAARDPEQGIPFPPNLTLDGELIAYILAEAPAAVKLDLTHQFAKFKAHAATHARRCVVWRAAFLAWCLTALEKLAAAEKQQPVHSGPVPGRDATLAKLDEMRRARGDFDAN